MAKPNHQKISEYKEFREWRKNKRKNQELHKNTQNFHQDVFDAFKQKVITGEVQSFDDINDPAMRVGIMRMVLDEIDGTHFIMQLIPSLRFKAEWEVQVLPNFMGSFANFRVNGYISVYLDMYNRLGFYGGPYWEVLDGRTNETYRFKLNDAGRLINLIDTLIPLKEEQTEI